MINFSEILVGDTWIFNKIIRQKHSKIRHRRMKIFLCTGFAEPSTSLLFTIAAILGIASRQKFSKSTKNFFNMIYFLVLTLASKLASKKGCPSIHYTGKFCRPRKCAFCEWLTIMTQGCKGPSFSGF